MDNYYITIRLESDNLKFRNYEPPFGFIYNAIGAITNGRAHVDHISFVDNSTPEYTISEEFTTYLQAVLHLTPDQATNKKEVLKEVARFLEHCNHGTYISGNNKMQIVGFDYIEGFADLK